MKKMIKTLLSAVLAIAIMLCAVACGDVNLDDEVKNGTDVDVSTPLYGFVAREEDDFNLILNKEDPLDGTKPDMNFKVGTTYYLIITFTITPRQDNDGESYFHTTARFDNIDVLDAKIKEASTSTTTNDLVHNMENDAYERNVKASFKIAASVEDTRKYTMVVRMVPNKANDDVQLKIVFSLDGNYKIRGDEGSDGFTKLIEISKGKLQAPELAYEDLKLTWNQVKNASYYVVYDIDNKPIKFKNEKGEMDEKIEAKTGIEVGKSVEAPLLDSDLVEGHQQLRVKAFGKNGENDESFYSSDYSNTVVMDW